MTLFTTPKEMPDMASGVRNFVKKVVRKSDLVAGKAERERLKGGCDVVCESMDGLLNS